MIKERCFTQLRTKEQLGYIVKSLVRRSNGAQGIKIVVQSEFEPEYLDARIEAFIEGLEEALEQMGDPEFNSHIEALATKRLEKPKQLVARNSRYWSEIQGQQYNFNRDEVEVAELRRLIKEDLLKYIPLVPNQPFHCPYDNCQYTTKDSRQALVRHYGMTHKVVQGILGQKFPQFMNNDPFALKLHLKTFLQ